MMTIPGTAPNRAYTSGGGPRTPGARTEGRPADRQRPGGKGDVSRQINSGQEAAVRPTAGRALGAGDGQSTERVFKTFALRGTVRATAPRTQ